MLVSHFGPGDKALAFPDTEKHWAGQQIQDGVSSGWANGYPDGTFQPDRAVTRAEAAALINRALGISEDHGADLTDYRDMNQGSWDWGPLSTAVAAGYMSGYDDGTLRPGREVSRQEMAVMLARVAKPSEDGNNNAPIAFTDPVPAWSQGAIKTAVSEGWMQGYPDGSFRAQKFLSRAEAIVILGRFIQGETWSSRETRYMKRGIYGPDTGRQNVEGSVTVGSSGVILQNMTIAGDLIFAEQLGEGEAELRSLVVKGKVVVQGGGENSIVLQDSEIAELSVHKKNGKAVRILAKGTTTVGQAHILSSAILEEQEMTGSGFKEVLLSKELILNSLVRLRGHFETVAVQSLGAILELETGRIGLLDIAGEARNIRISLMADTGVDVAKIGGPVEFSGQGKIANAEIKAEGVKFDRRPDRVSCVSGISHALCVTGAGSSSTGSGSSGGGNSGEGNQPATVTALVYEPETVVLTKPGDTLQLKLTAQWSNGNVTEVTGSAEWNSRNPDIVTISETGVVTAVQDGLAVIEASYRGLRREIPARVTGEIIPPETPTVTELVYQPKKVLLTARGEQALVQLTAVWSDGTSSDIVNEASWRSLDTKVATVSSSGVIEAAGEGSTMVEASYKGVTVSILVDVVLDPQVGEVKTVAAEIADIAPSAGASNTLELTVKRADGSIDTSFSGLKKVTLSLSGPVRGSMYGFGTWNGKQMMQTTHESEVSFREGKASIDLALFKADPHTLTFHVQDVADPETVLHVTPTALEPARMIVSKQETEGTAKSGMLFLNLTVDLLDRYDNLAVNSAVQVRASVNGTSSNGPELAGNSRVTSVNGRAVFEDLYGRGVGNLVLDITADGLPRYEAQPVLIKAPFAGSGTTKDPYLVGSAELLNEVRYYLSASFKQVADIDLSSYSSGEGWAPIGEITVKNNTQYPNPFKGSYNGGGYAISNMNIKAERNWLGLFGYVNEASLSDIHLKNAFVEGTIYIGGLIGQADQSLITGSSVEGEVRGISIFGGLVGRASGGSIHSSSALVSLAATKASSSVVIGVNGGVGGLIGNGFSVAITDSYAEGSILTDDYDYYSGIGGLAGTLSGFTTNPSSVEKSYANFDMQIQHGSTAGGLAGSIINSKLINNYALGRLVIGSSNYQHGAGGLVGNSIESIIQSSYAAVKIAADPTQVTGGLAGKTDAKTDVLDSYYDSEVSGQYDTGKGVPANTNAMNMYSTYSGWDFQSVWSMTNGCGYPFLSWQKKDPSSLACFQVRLLEEGVKTEGERFQLLITGAKDSAGRALGGYVIVYVYLNTTSSAPIYSGQVEPFVNGERTMDLAVQESGQVRLIIRIADVSGSQALDVELAPHPFDGGKGTPENPYLISTAEQLDKLRNFSTSYFKMTRDIDLNVTPYNSGAGWMPIGDDSVQFRGGLDGNGYAIRGLKINNTAAIPTGLFGRTQGAKIRNLQLTEVDITTTAPRTGGLAGYFFGGQVENISVQGRITSTTDKVGGLAGILIADAMHIETNVVLKGNYDVGGIAGMLEVGKIIESSSSRGSVEATYVNAGGIVGNAITDSIIRNSYSLSEVKASNNAGGIAGKAWGLVEKCYSAGALLGDASKGGIAGGGTGSTITDCYYDSAATGVTNIAGGEPKTPEDMKIQGTYVNWDFTNVWVITEGTGYPELRWFAP